MQTQNRARLTILQLLFVVSFAEECQRNAVCAQRRLDAVGDILLIGNGILIGEVFARMLHMRLEVEIRAICDAPKLAPAEWEEVFDIRRGVGIVRKLFGGVIAQLDALFWHSQAEQEVFAVILPEIEPLHLLFGVAEEFQLHLLEFTGAESEVSGRDLVAEGFADLRDAHGHFAAGAAQHVFEVDENSLGCLGAQENLRGSILIDALEGFKHQVEFADGREVVFAAGGAGDMLGDELLHLLIIHRGDIQIKLMLEYVVLDELIRAETLVALFAIHQRIVEAAHMPGCDPGFRVLTLKKDMKGPILCFVGPPGVGKTSIARSVANALGRKFVRMSLGGMKDESEIRGHRRTYIGALPGRIASGIKQAGSMNPVFLLDEIDKLSSDYRGDPASAMLEVLDGETNHDFRDNYLDIGLDLSRVLFIATANDAGSIPPALYDRMEMIELSSYTPYEKEQIAKKHLIPKQIAENGMSNEMLKIQPAALKRIIAEYTSESGVRALERQLARICRKAAKSYLETNQQAIVGKKNLEKFLGKPHYLETNLPKRGDVGIAIGLAWTANGGVTLPIEVCVMEGSGEVELTGQLGDVMKESAKAAITIVRSKAEQLGISGNFHKEKDLHIHVPEGAIPKDGPSAGITMTLAVASALLNRKVRDDFAMTGEVTLTGRVLAIGGLQEKVFAAVRAGLKNVIIPKDNMVDLEEIPEEVRGKVRFWPVREIEEVFRLGLEEQK